MCSCLMFPRTCLCPPSLWKLSITVVSVEYRHSSRKGNSPSMEHTISPLDDRVKKKKNAYLVIVYLKSAVGLGFK